MSTLEKREAFEITYSAGQQEEIERIRNKYLVKQESKMEQLIKMDKQAEKPGQLISISVGVIGCLLLGIGMCCTMVWNTGVSIFVAGIVIGLIGLVLAGIAYPINKRVTEKERAKIADQILALTNELSFEN